MIPYNAFHKLYPASTSQSYLNFDVVVRLAWSNDPKSYAGGSVGTGRVSHAGQFEGDGPD
jgi:hypothetical protein